MSNNNAVSISGSGNQFSQILTSNIPPGLAAILLAYRLQRYGASLFPICQNPNLPCPVLSLNIPLSFHQSPLTKPLTKLGLRASLAVIDARKLLHALKAWIRANPKQLIAICVGFAFFILGFGPPTILGAIGFGPTGPVRWSIAAAWQSSIGSVAAGSLFAFLQSAAMTEAVKVLFYVIGALGVVVLFAVGASMEFVRRKAVDIAKIVREKVEKAGEAVKDGVCQVGMASAIKAVRVAITVEGWRREMKGE